MNLNKIVIACFFQRPSQLCVRASTRKPMVIGNHTKLLMCFVLCCFGSGGGDFVVRCPGALKFTSFDISTKPTNERSYILHEV